MSADNRNRVQPGVSTGGQFAAESRPEDPAVSLDLRGPEHDPIELEPGGYHEFPSTADVLSYDIYRDEDGSYSTSAQLYDVHLGDLLCDPRAPIRDGIEDLDTEVGDLMFRGDEAALRDLFEARYGQDGASLADNDENVLRVTIQRDYDHAPTEHEALNDSWPQVARQVNEMDSGTHGSEFFGRLAREHMDAQAVLAIPHDATAESPDALLQGAKYQKAIEDSLSGWKALPDRYAQAIAIKHEADDPLVSQLATKGYANSKALQEIDDRGDIELRALKAWASKATPFTERLSTALAEY